MRRFPLYRNRDLLEDRSRCEGHWIDSPVPSLRPKREVRGALAPVPSTASTMASACIHSWLLSSAPCSDEPRIPLSPRSGNSYEHRLKNHQGGARGRSHQIEARSLPLQPFQMTSDHETIASIVSKSTKNADGTVRDPLVDPLGRAPSSVLHQTRPDIPNVLSRSDRYRAGFVARKVKPLHGSIPFWELFCEVLSTESGNLASKQTIPNRRSRVPPAPRSQSRANQEASPMNNAEANANGSDAVSEIEDGNGGQGKWSFALKKYMPKSRQAKLAATRAIERRSQGGKPVGNHSWPAQHRDQKGGDGPTKSRINNCRGCIERWLIHSVKGLNPMIRE